MYPYKAHIVDFFGEALLLVVVVIVLLVVTYKSKDQLSCHELVKTWGSFPAAGQNS